MTWGNFVPCSNCSQTRSDAAKEIERLNNIIRCNEADWSELRKDYLALEAKLAAVRAARNEACNIAQSYIYPDDEKECGLTARLVALKKVGDE